MLGNNPLISPVHFQWGLLIFSKRNVFLFEVRTGVFEKDTTFGRYVLVEEKKVKEWTTGKKNFFSKNFSADFSLKKFLEKFSLFSDSHAPFFQFFFLDEDTLSKSSILFKDIHGCPKQKKIFFCQKCFFGKNQWG